jgi:hypothetical protein
LGTTVRIARCKEFRSHAAIAQGSSGPGDTDFGVKWNFRSSPEIERVALTSTFYIEVPTGDVHQQLGSGLTDYWLNFIAQKPIKTKSRINANIGFLFAGNTSTGVGSSKLNGGASILTELSQKGT